MGSEMSIRDRINNLLATRKQQYDAAVTQGLLDAANANTLFMEEVANVLANFDTAQQTAFDAYTDAQAAEQTRLNELDQLLYGQVDPTLAPGDFNIARTVSQGVAEENLGFLDALKFIGGLTGDAMTTMGGTVARDEGGEIVLDERGRPQFGGGMFGQIAQDLLADERAMNLAAEEEANTALAALASGELDAATLAGILNMTPEQFMAAQSSGVDLAGILESRDQFDRTMTAQGIDPNTGLPYGFDTTTGLTAAEAANLAAAEARAAVEDARWRTQTIDD